MKKILTALVLLFITATSGLAMTGNDNIRPGHWSYMSLKTLSDDGLITKQIDLRSTVITANEILDEVEKAIKAIQAKPEALTEDSLISLRQLINAYKPILEARGKDFFLYRKELENCAIKAGLTAMETGVKTEKGTPLYSKASRSVNAFTFDLYTKLSSNQKGNLMVSPYSIYSALAMTYLGAEGKTAEEFEELLRFTPELHRNMTALINETNSTTKDEGTVRVANAIWPSKNLKVKMDYKKKVKELYGTEITPQDYVKNPEGSRKTINSWVEDKTERKIKNLVPAGALNANTKLVLTNAVYFNAEWADQFDYKDTKVKKFYPEEGTPVNLSFMTQATDFAKYGEFDNLQALSLNYAMGRYSMLVLLPKKGEKLSEIEKKLNSTYFFKIESAMSESRVQVELPKFKAEYKAQLTGTLAEMGLKNATSPSRADFNKISKEKGFFIDQVLHKTFIEVGEKGTEAAAATAVMIRTMALMPETEQPILFRADRPFMYLIRDNKTGAILFIGRYVKP